MEEKSKQQLNLYIDRSIVTALKMMEINISEAVEKFLIDFIDYDRESQNKYLGKHKNEGKIIEVVGKKYVWKTDKYVEVKGQSVCIRVD